MIVLSGLIIGGIAWFVGNRVCRARRLNERRLPLPQPEAGQNQRNTTRSDLTNHVAHGTSRQGLSKWTGATRQQHLKDVTSALDESTQSDAERKINRNLKIATVSFSLAAIGGLGYPIWTLLSLPGFFYIAKQGVMDSYYALINKRQITVDALAALVKVILFINGHFVLCNLGAFSYAFNRKILFAIKDHTRKNMVDVFRQQPHTAWVLIDDVEMECPCHTLQTGDIVVVHAGETIPIDGVITGGIALIDQKMLTGEAQPVEKEAGARVFALTIVVSGRVYIRVEKAGEETTAAQIGQLLNRTVDGKTEMQFWVESISNKTAGPTLLASACLFPFIGLMSATAFIHAHPKYRTTIAGAIDIMNYLNLAARRGILIKDGRTFELLARVDTVVFDKTGTLTEEQPHVGRIYTDSGYEEDEILRYAAAAEANQTHPVAAAICQAAALRRLELPPLDEAAYLVGYGLTVMVGYRLVQVGSARFMDMETLAIPDAFLAAQDVCHAHGHSLVMVAIDSQVVGAIELCPAVRPEARAIVHGLRQRGVSSMYIISGDHDKPTQKLAWELGIGQYFAETLPEHKADLIEQLQREGKSVCYVGDGINDAIALKQATVSVSLRGAATVATDAAQVILMDESLRRLVDLFDLAQAHQSHIKTTFLTVLIPHLIGMGGALFFQWGFLYALCLANFGMFAGVAHAMFPETRQLKAAAEAQDAVAAGPTLPGTAPHSDSGAALAASMA